MKLIGSTLVAALAAAAALPAAASPAFDTFKSVCGDSHADLAAIKTALAGKDWTPTESLPTNMEGVTTTESIARTATIGNQKVSIYAWEGVKGQFHMTACTARAAALPLGQANTEAKAWLGFAPESTGGKSTWRYGLKNGAASAVKPADFQAAAGAGGLYFFNLFADHGEVVLDLLKIKS